MNHKFLILYKIALLLWMVGISGFAKATCYLVDYNNGDNGLTTINKVTDTGDIAAAKIPIGNLNLNPFQAVGEKIAEITVSPMEYKVRNATANTILWRCDPQTVMTDIRFLVATNGNALHGGQVEVTGLPNVYYTGFQGIGIRQTMAGVTLSRTWKSIPVIANNLYEKGTHQGTVSNATQCPTDWYCIRLKHIPNLQVEFFKVTGQPGSGTCGEVKSSGNYSCKEPSAYIQLADNLAIGGPLPVSNDTDGQDSRFYITFLGANNGFGYTLYNAANLIPTDIACSASSPNVVNFPATTVSHLNEGGEVSQNFNITINCQGSEAEDSTFGRFVYGIQASYASYTHANALGLVNNDNGVTALVSDDYTDAARAKNVGIFLYKDNHSTLMNLIGQPGSTGSLVGTSSDSSLANPCKWNLPIIAGTGTGTCYSPITFQTINAAGWYSFSDNMQELEGVKSKTIPLTAVLKKLPGSGTVTAGSVRATAHVLVKLQ